MSSYTPTYRIFSIIAYDDSDTLEFGDILSNIKLNNYSYIYIKHNKDNKKTHYHIALYFSTPKTIEFVANKLLIGNNNINVTDDNNKRYTLKNTVKYFLHYDMKNKHNYSYDEIKTNIPDTVEKYYNIITGNNTESSQLNEIMQFIEINHILKISSVINYCIDNNLLKTFKKYSYILNQVIIEERLK